VNGFGTGQHDLPGSGRRPATTRKPSRARRSKQRSRPGTNRLSFVQQTTSGFLPFRSAMLRRTATCARATPRVGGPAGC